MAAPESFLHTTHRTVSWFLRAFDAEQLQLRPPYQRNVVWTDKQRSFLIDTILSGLPIPELYMQDVVESTGEEKYLLVDGQQRITAVIGYLKGEYRLEGEDVSRQWRGLSFDELTDEQKRSLFSYKFVVRILPGSEEDIRLIFARLNRNVEALNDQELRNATYSGPFIRTVQRMADEDPFWAESGIFSANDHRRMLDQEFISELLIAFLHGPQNKKDKLDTYYQAYEEYFEEGSRVEASFRSVTSELTALLPDLKFTRWRKKSDFYTLFLLLASKAGELPWPRDEREKVGRRLYAFGDEVDRLVRLDEGALLEAENPTVQYARAVSRAASDRANRIAREEALARFIFGDAATDGDN